MERLDYIDQARVQFWRTHDIQGAAAGEDDDLRVGPIEAQQQHVPANVDMRSRTDVAWYNLDDGTSAATLLKRDDDVVLCGIPWRVVGPARDRRFVTLYNQQMCGDMAMTFDVTGVTDRAPLDPEEPPMPIIPEPEPEPPGPGRP